MQLKLTLRRILLLAVTLILLTVAALWFESWYNSLDRKFARSKSALDAYAAQVMAGNPSAPLTPPARIGELEASDAFRLPNGFAFRSHYGNWTDWNGFAYSTQPLPAQMPDPFPPFQMMFCEKIQGNWYKVWRN